MMNEMWFDCWTNTGNNGMFCCFWEIDGKNIDVDNII
jgi:hypothetical protein